MVQEVQKAFLCWLEVKSYEFVVENVLVREVSVRETHAEIVA